jgi:hypothetical protein
MIVCRCRDGMIVNVALRIHGELLKLGVVVN